MSDHPYLTDQQLALARNQGWNVFQVFGSHRFVEGAFYVQKIDEAGILSSDDEAIALARRMGLNLDENGRVLDLSHLG